MYRITFGIGMGEDQHGQPISSSDLPAMIAAATRRVCKTFGGCNAVRGEGAWLDDSGRLIQESTLLITSDVPDMQRRELMRMADDVAGHLRYQFDQASVHVAVQRIDAWGRGKDSTDFDPPQQTMADAD